MLSKKELKAFISQKVTMSFSRSSGAGGQNVNKVNTKVLAALAFSDLTFLSPDEQTRLALKLKNRITKGGVIYVQVQDERSQSRNLALAVERLTAMIAAALHRPRRRRKTRVPAAALARRKNSKIRHTEKKRWRKSLRSDE
jgi:ribosome-associated protein